MQHNSIKAILYALLLSVCLQASSQDSDGLDTPVQSNNQQVYQFEILSEVGYTDENGRRIIDVIEGYQVNLALAVETDQGQPVIGLEAVFTLSGSSFLIAPGQLASRTSTDESGILEFGIMAGRKGMDELTVSFGANEASVYLNIISLSRNNFPVGPTQEVDLSWPELMQTKLDFVDGDLEISFPKRVQERQGERVKIWGFMMPLNADLQQKHFLVTSSPPHCFFDIPGGPAGVVEVFADQGVEASWEPVLLQGTLALISDGSAGVIYQLKQAVLIEH